MKLASECIDIGWKRERETHLCVCVVKLVNLVSIIIRKLDLASDVMSFMHLT